MIDKEYDEIDDGDFVDDLDAEYDDDAEVEPTVDSLLDDLAELDAEDYGDETDELSSEPFSGETGFSD